MDSNPVKEGDHVVLMRSFDSENMKITPVIRDSIVHYGKFHFDASPIIGCEYGTVFKIHDGTMTKIEDFTAYENEVSTAIATKSTTHSAKSQFSQEKMIKKKKKLLHSNIVTVIRPTLLLINEMLYARDKLGGLRMDTLSQILTLANIHNGCRSLVIDNNLGLITSAVISRCLPDGLCIQLVTDQESIYTTRNTLSMLNLGDDICGNKLLALTIKDLYRVLNMEDIFSEEDKVMQLRNNLHLERLNTLLIERQSGDTQTTDNSRMETDDDNQDGFVAEGTKSDATRTKDLIAVVTKKEANRKARSDERNKARDELRTRTMDSVIIASPNDHPLDLLKLLWQALSFPSQFVIYNDSIQPLIECYQFLKDKTNRLDVVSLTLSESWLRKLQVLPDRTRPEMNGSGYGGYLLSGTKVLVVDRQHKPQIS